MKLLLLLLPISAFGLPLFREERLFGTLSDETREKLNKNWGFDPEERKAKLQRIKRSVKPNSDVLQIVQKKNSSDNSILGINDRVGVTEYLYQGDIHLSERQLDKLMNEKERSKRQIWQYAKKWTNNEVFYHFDTSYTEDVKKQVRDAVNFIQRETCLTFKEDATATNRIKISKIGGCFAALGMEGGEQRMSLDDGCEQFGVVVHEFFHALGVIHTQSRSDRDNYITVDLTYVDEPQEFKKESNDIIYTPYEYGSIMQYKPDSFVNKTGELSMIAKDQKFQKTMGNYQVTFYDIFMINTHYNCKDKCPAATSAKCENSGYPNPRNCAVCLCPKGFGGPLCAVRPPGCGEELAATPDWQKGKIVAGDRVTGVTQNGNSYSFKSRELMECYTWITAPPGKEIQVVIKKLENSYCALGCITNGIQLKADKDILITNPLVCCDEQINEIITSKLNPTPIIAFNHMWESITDFEYRYVDAMTTTTESATTVESTTAEVTTVTTAEATTAEATTAEVTTAEVTTVTTAEATTAEATTAEVTTAEVTTVTTAEATTAEATTTEVTTAEVTTVTTAEATTAEATTTEVTTAEVTTVTTAEATTAEATTAEVTTAEATTVEVTTAEPSTVEVTTAEVTTAKGTTVEVTTAEATTAKPSTVEVTTAEVTTAEGTTVEVTTAEATPAEATTAEATTAEPTTVEITTAEPSTVEVTTAEATTAMVTTAEATAAEVTTAEATTAEVTTAQATTAELTTAEGTTVEVTTAVAITAEATTAEITTTEVITAEATTAATTTLEATTTEVTTAEVTTVEATTAEVAIAEATTERATTTTVTCTTTVIPAITTTPVPTKPLNPNFMVPLKRFYKHSELFHRFHSDYGYERLWLSDGMYLEGSIGNIISPQLYQQNKAAIDKECGSLVLLRSFFKGHEVMTTDASFAQSLKNSGCWAEMPEVGYCSSTPSCGATKPLRSVITVAGPPDSVYTTQDHEIDTLNTYDRFKGTASSVICYLF